MGSARPYTSLSIAGRPVKTSRVLPIVFLTPDDAALRAALKETQDPKPKKKGQEQERIPGNYFILSPHVGTATGPALEPLAAREQPAGPGVRITTGPPRLRPAAWDVRDGATHRSRTPPASHRESSISG